MATSDSAYQQEILDACSTGAIAVLKELFKSHGINQGTAPIRFLETTERGCPSTEDMLSAAIRSKQAALVRFLLEYFNGYPADSSEALHEGKKPISFDSGVVLAVLDSPDVETLQVLLDYDPGLVNFEFDNHFTFLWEACNRDPDKIGPVIKHLVAHGADMQASFYLIWDLSPAICGDQHVDVMEAMVANGANITYTAVLYAVRKERADVLQMVLDKGGVSGGRMTDTEVKKLREEGQAAEDVLVTKLVEKLLSSAS